MFYGLHGFLVELKVHVICGQNLHNHNYLQVTILTANSFGFSFGAQPKKTAVLVVEHGTSSGQDEKTR